MAGDLNLKKSWNPALIKNQKKIWEEEQAKLKEHKKIGELNKELNREEEFKNLLTMRYGNNFDKANLTPNERLRLNKLNWMYEGAAEENKVNSAGFVEKGEFTEGKKEVENMLNGSRYVRKSHSSTTGDKLGRILLTGTAKVEKRTDDPLLIIKSQKMARRQGGGKLDRVHKLERSERHHSGREHRLRDSRERQKQNRERSPTRPVNY